MQAVPKYKHSHAFLEPRAVHYKSVFNEGHRLIQPYSVKTYLKIDRV